MSLKTIWLKAKNQALGENYDLSVFFLPSKEMRRLSKTYRKKDYPANVLSFPLDKKSGEILINESYEKNGKKSFYLFVHSLLHLKGFRHGSIMNRAEKKIMKKHFPKDYGKIMGEFSQ